jgi:glycosyltransferase involved in cell wall biosynthesis
MGQTTDVSIGIMAHNEEKNIGQLLDVLCSEKTRSCSIREIIVVDDGSTDRTNNIVLSFSKRDGRVKLLVHERRLGKACAVNTFLSVALSHILVLESADTLPVGNAIENLCAPFKDRKIGITTAHAIPLNKNEGLLGNMIHTQWNIHHSLSSLHPKFCELIAFRNVVEPIEPTCVDEETLGASVLSKGYMAFYAADALFLTMGPQNLREFFSQRRRNHCGHLLLKQGKRYISSSLMPCKIARAVQRQLSFKNLLPVGCLVLLELLARAWGRLDMLKGKNYALWEQAKTTKALSPA